MYSEKLAAERERTDNVGERERLERSPEDGLGGGRLLSAPVAHATRPKSILIRVAVAPIVMVAARER